MATVLGIDGGATKTHAIIMDETGAVLGEGFGGVGNYTVVGAEGAQQSFADAVAAARAAAGLDNETDGIGVAHECCPGSKRAT